MPGFQFGHFRKQAEVGKLLGYSNPKHFHGIPISTSKPSWDLKHAQGVPKRIWLVDGKHAHDTNYSYMGDHGALSYNSQISSEISGQFSEIRLL